MVQHLVLTVRMHGDAHGTARFHGMVQGNAEWPPAPFRLFQALLAGAARGNALPSEVAAALEWLEGLPPPIIAAPRKVAGQRVELFVPNNDADSLPDPREVSAIRTKKMVAPSLFDADVPFVYAWALPEGSAPTLLIEVANQVYQLGRGVDPAWAYGELLDDAALDSRLVTHPGIVHRPSLGADGHKLLCAVAGSLRSLVDRHHASRLTAEGTGRAARVLFTNAPKPRALPVAYAPAHVTRRILFDLRDRSSDKAWPWATHAIVKLVETLRDAAAERLRHGLPGHDEQIERAIVGRKADGRDQLPAEHRVRIVPLPSIGSVHADRAIRRVLVDIPSGAPLSGDDVEWAFSGLEWARPTDGVMSPLVVTRADENNMLEHYQGPSTRWRSVTPLALPESAKRRRIEPSRQSEEAKDGKERTAEEARAVAAVHTALRQAGVRATAIIVRVQREPFEARGVRAESFAEGTRFAKERLWHVEMELDRAVSGPVVVGDGRFLGLGLMAPTAEARALPVRSAEPRTDTTMGSPIWAFAALGEATDQPLVLAHALRRAVMSRVDRELTQRGRSADERLDRYVSGHEASGSKAIDGERLAYHWDPLRRWLLVIAPRRLDHERSNEGERRLRDAVAAALEGFDELRAGVAGRFAVRSLAVDPDDRLVVASRSWTSITPYQVNRHAKRTSARDALTVDVLADCRRRRLPTPHVTVLDVLARPGRALEGLVRLDFEVAVKGPVILGRTRYLGGGLFHAEGR
jgi:CRISPR-associated protein Csb2